MNDLEKLFEHAPEGATEVVSCKDGELMYAKSEGTWVSNVGWVVRATKWKTIATRLQPETRKTVEDAVEFFKEWPSENGHYKFLHYCEKVKGFIFDTKLDCDAATYLVCTREQFEAYVAANNVKTVEDAVEAFPDGFPKELSFPGEQGWWFNSNRELIWVDQRGLGRKMTIVCNQSEFEAFVAAKAAKSEPEWTHAYTDDTGEDVECIALAEYEEWAWVQDAGTIETINKSWLKPIKPTISTERALELMKKMCPDEWTHEFNNSNPRKLKVLCEEVDCCGNIPVILDGPKGKLYTTVLPSNVRTIKPTISRDAKEQLDIYVQYRIDRYGDYETKEDLLDYLSHHNITN